MLITLYPVAQWQNFVWNLPFSQLPDEEDLADDDDEDFDDQGAAENDLNEIRVNDDIGEPDPEDDDHLPDEELQ